MKIRTVDTGAIALTVAEAGVGGRPLLLLHGFTGAKEDFTDWLDPLAGLGWHAVAPDHRGHGASPKPEGQEHYSFEILAADSLALAGALGWSRFALLGHSMGGMVAQLMAGAAPERLSALVLMDTSHGPLRGIDPEAAALAATIAVESGIDALADAMAERESPLDTPAHQRLLAERPGYAEFNDRKFRATSPHLYAAIVAQIVSGADRLDRLAGLPVPTLVLVGDQDEPFIEPSRRMAAAVPGAQLVVIPGAGHSPQFETPEPWWEALTGFLATVAP